VVPGRANGREAGATGPSMDRINQLRANSPATRALGADPDIDRRRRGHWFPVEAQPGGPTPSRLAVRTTTSNAGSQCSYSTERGSGGALLRFHKGGRRRSRAFASGHLPFVQLGASPARPTMHPFTAGAALLPPAAESAARVGGRALSTLAGSVLFGVGWQRETWTWRRAPSTTNGRAASTRPRGRRDRLPISPALGLPLRALPRLMSRWVTSSARVIRALRWLSSSEWRGGGGH
jgi:hypothetical protein